MTNQTDHRELHLVALIRNQARVATLMLHIWVLLKLDSK